MSVESALILIEMFSGALLFVLIVLIVKVYGSAFDKDD